MIENVSVPTEAGAADAYLAVPKEPASKPGVLLYMDVFGLRPRLAQMAEAFAARGHPTLVPNLFFRRGRAPFADPMAELRAHAPAMYVEDAGGYLDFFGGARVLVVGYCLGGSVALRTAAAHPDRVAAVASFHAGGLATELPTSPHLLAPKIACEVYVAHADHDQSMPPEQQRRFAAALTDAGVRFRAEVYENCRHGFTMSDRDVYDADGEARHWREVFALFDRAGA